MTYLKLFHLILPFLMYTNFNIIKENRFIKIDFCFTPPPPPGPDSSPGQEMKKKIVFVVDFILQHSLSQELYTYTNVYLTFGYLFHIVRFVKHSKLSFIFAFNSSSFKANFFPWSHCFILKKG